MITCKHDLINTAVFCRNGELRDSYINKCKEFGILWEHNLDIDKYSLLYVSDGAELHGVQADGDFYYKEHKRLTLSDLKPRTKVEYELIKFESTADAYRAMLDGEKLYSQDGESEFLFDGKNFVGIDSDGGVYTLECHSDNEPFYRKVERPVEWWEDAIDYLEKIPGTENLVYSKKYDSISIEGDYTRRELYDLARILLEQEDENKNNASS